MSNDIRAENRKHHRNERKQANRDEKNRRQNERNQARPKLISREMH